MNEQRLEAYLKIIQALLNCDRGKEREILQINSGLIDAGLIKTMAGVAAMLLERGDTEAAEWLQNVAAPLASEMVNFSPVASQAYLNFLTQLLQATSDSNGDPYVVYPLLQANLEKLDRKFAQILQQWAMATLPQVKSKEAPLLAATLGTLSNLMAQFPLGDRESKLEIAIALYEIVVKIFTRDHPLEWATTQNNLGNAYRNRHEGDRTLNLEKAIAAYKAALEVYTRDAFPEDWAMVQNNLGNAYRDRIQGDKVQNLTLAIAAYKDALQVYTREAFPEKSATIQNNMAVAREHMIENHREKNLENG